MTKKNDVLNEPIRAARLRARHIAASLANGSAIPCDGPYRECPYCFSQELFGAIDALQRLALDLSEVFDELRIPLPNGKL